MMDLLHLSLINNKLGSYLGSILVLSEVKKIISSSIDIISKAGGIKNTQYTKITILEST